MNPFTTLFKTVPIVIPNTISVVGMVNKPIIMSPGGRVGIANVTKKRTKNADTKTAAFDISECMLKTFIIFFWLSAKNKQTISKTSKSSTFNDLYQFSI
jgi:hypothetical protein